MSVTADDVMTQRPKFHSTLVALEIEAHLNDDPWALGDELVKDTADIRDALLQEGHHPSRKTGLYGRLDEIQAEMLKFGALTVAKSRASLVTQEGTAYAWPEQFRRPALATWRAHAALRSKAFQGGAGVEVLEHLHKYNKGKRVSETDRKIAVAVKAALVERYDGDYLKRAVYDLFGSTNPEILWGSWGIE